MVECKPVMGSCAIGIAVSSEPGHPSWLAAAIIAQRVNPIDLTCAERIGEAADSTGVGRVLKISSQWRSERHRRPLPSLAEGGHREESPAGEQETGGLGKDKNGQDT